MTGSEVHAAWDQMKAREADSNRKWLRSRIQPDRPEHPESLGKNFLLPASIGGERLYHSQSLGEVFECSRGAIRADHHSMKVSLQGERNDFPLSFYDE